MTDGINAIPAWVEGIIVVLTLGGVLATALWSTEGRGVVLAFVAAPIIFCLVVSYLYRPIWLYRTLAYTAPFWSIAIAILVFRIVPGWVKKRNSQPWMRFGPAFIVVGVLLLSTLLQQTTFSRDWWPVRDVARFLQSVTQPGDVVYVPNERVFWGMGWYSAGPGSVNPLTTDYTLVSPANVKLFSKPASPLSPDNADLWLVYRSTDDVAPYVVKPDDSVWDFGNMKVVRENR